jgi:glycosyltransferase involved in cell wall biosynthesis
MSLKECLVSVLVRTRDIEYCFNELLLKLSHQTLRPIELVIVDNFSSEKKLKEMTQFLSSAKQTFFNDKVKVKLIPLRDEEFSHPYSTNVGVSVANGDLVCITNGHSLPSSNKWLEVGVDPFRDAKVAGVGGYTASHGNATIWEKIGYDWLWRKRSELSKVYAKDDFFSTVNCVLRRSLWKEYPFDERLPNEIPDAERFGGEDYDWAVEMEARGYKIVVEPTFTVFHSHREPLTALLLKYLVWRQIRKKIRLFKRPRRSYTRLSVEKPSYYEL